MFTRYASELRTWVRFPSPAPEAILMQFALLDSRLEYSPLCPEFWTQLEANSGRARDFGRDFWGARVLK
jgi:hypothetical protein